MQNYVFHIAETRELTLEIEAESLHEAEKLAHAYYYEYMDDEYMTSADDLEVTLKIYGAICDENKCCEWG